VGTATTKRYVTSLIRRHTEICRSLSQGPSLKVLICSQQGVTDKGISAQETALRNQPNPRWTTRGVPWRDRGGGCEKNLMISNEALEEATSCSQQQPNC
jgi:hypothetical protein